MGRIFTYLHLLPSLSQTTGVDILVKQVPISDTDTTVVRSRERGRHTYFSFEEKQEGQNEREVVVVGLNMHRLIVAGVVHIRFSGERSVCRHCSTVCKYHNEYFQPS